MNASNVLLTHSLSKECAIYAVHLSQIASHATMLLFARIVWLDIHHKKAKELVANHYYHLAKYQTV
jgi:hypothetical protein